MDLAPFDGMFIALGNLACKRRDYGLASELYQRFKAVSPELAHIADMNLGRLAKKKRERAPARALVDIVIPVCNALEDVKKCLGAILAIQDPCQKNIHVINDGSGPETTAWLRSIAADAPIRLLENATNLGYTVSINKAIRQTDAPYVCLLNSDTIPAPGWLSAMVKCLESSADIGLVGPLSNAANYQSIPLVLDRDGSFMINEIPDGLDVEEYGELARLSSTGEYPRLAIINGFCMLVDKKVFERVGLFDEENFPIGYGEENDLCIRAAKQGFQCAVADDAFVFHAKSKSFGHGQRKIHTRNAAIILESKHGGYRRLLADLRLEQTNPDCALNQQRMRFELIARHYQQYKKRRKNILYVISSRTGGTPQTNQDLMGAVADSYNTFLLYCDGKNIKLYDSGGFNGTLLKHHELEREIDLESHNSSEYDGVFASILYAYDINLVHLRHVARHSLGLFDVCAQKNIPVIYSLHDYYTCCPNLNLFTAGGVYCGGECAGGCRPKLWQTDRTLDRNFVSAWRKRHADCMNKCGHLVTTHAVARELVSTLLPIAARNFTVIPHGRDFPRFGRVGQPPKAGEIIRLVVPGNINEPKGARLLLELVQKSPSTWEFHFLGDTRSCGYLKNELAGRAFFHDSYERGDFITIMEAIQPHAGLILSLWSETFCHTLTELWAAGIPALVTDIGAHGARTRATQAGWLIGMASREKMIAEIIGTIGNLAVNPQMYLDVLNRVYQLQAEMAEKMTVKGMAAAYLEIYGSCLRQGMNGALKK